jgi:succinate dehydrogenase / fumarate reductase cytochrome b subunit
MFHRITGFGVFLFLMLHVVDVSLTNNRRLYNEVHALYGNVVFRVFEVGLLFGLLYHALNGLRIILIDFFPEGVRADRAMFAIVVFLTVAAGIPGGFIILRPFLEGNF